MANTVGELNVEIGANLTRFEKALDKMERSIKGTGKKSEKAAGDSFGKIGGVIAGAFAVDRIAAFAMKIIEVRGEFEKFEAVLTNTLGSQSAANKALSDIKAFAAETPFSVRELTDSFVKLANQGFKPTTDEMRKLGDLAASTGKSFDQLAEGIIDAQVGEFERLKEFGIRAEQQGDKVTFTFKGVSTQVDKTSESIQAYVLGLGDLNGVQGATAAIAGTLGGSVSMLGDAYDELLNNLGNSSAYKTAINGMTNFIKAINTAFTGGPLSKQLAQQVPSLIADGFLTGEKEIGPNPIELFFLDENGNLRGADDIKDAIERNSAQLLPLIREAQMARDKYLDSLADIEPTTEGGDDDTEAIREKIEAYHALGRKARAEIDAIASIEEALFGLKPSGLPTGFVGMGGEDPAIQEGIDQMEELIQKSVRVQEELAYAAEVGNVFGGVLQNAFEASLMKGENFFDVLADGLKKMIAQLAAAAATAAVLAGILGIFGIGGGFTKAFGAIFSGGGSGGGGTAGSFGGLFQLRGTDLVASTTRTNTQLGRSVG
jgi:uncharacterized protein YwgA